MLRTILVAAAFTVAAHSRASAEALQYTTTWLGNSFGGGEKWVQNFVDGVFVAPDGTVCVASGWVDFPDALRVFRRANGEYRLFVEEDAKGKILI